MAASSEVTAASPQQPSKRPRQELSQQEAVLLQPVVAAASKPKIQAGFSLNIFLLIAVVADPPACGRRFQA